MGVFNFKQFSIDDSGCGMKLGTDSVLLGAWADCPEPSRILDLGTGSGILALMCAQRFSDAQIVGIDADPGAIERAKANAKNSPWSSRLEMVCADAFAYAPAYAPDLIVCNPPYFPGDLAAPDSSRALARQGLGGLQPSAFSLQPLSAIALAARWLSPTGVLAMVTPAAGANEIIYTAELHRLKLRRQCSIATVEGKKPTRMLWQLSRIDGPCTTESLSIRDRSQAYTPAYAALTSPFYLKL